LSSAGLVYKVIFLYVSALLYLFLFFMNYPWLLHGLELMILSNLLFQHFGLEIVAKELGVDISHPDVERVYKAVYKYFVEV
jgi:hypothetical protein